MEAEDVEASSEGRDRLLMRSRPSMPAEAASRDPDVEADLTQQVEARAGFEKASFVGAGLGWWVKSASDAAEVP